MAISKEIRHPGPKANVRRHFVPVYVKRCAMKFSKGATLLQAVADFMESAGFDSAILLLNGIAIGPFSYVIPATDSPDGRRTAWYSETRSQDQACLEYAVASVGRRDGAWFMHCHAVWDSETAYQKAGHLLPDQVTIADTAEAVCLGCLGGAFEVLADEETGFSLFRPMAVGPARSDANGVLVALAPFEDVGQAADDAAASFNLGDVRLYGLGSLIGAPFKDAPPMESTISEVLLLDGATSQSMPFHCVDPENTMFRGTLESGQAKTCVTFEMVIAKASL